MLECAQVLPQHLGSMFSCRCWALGPVPWRQDSALEFSAGTRRGSIKKSYFYTVGGNKGFSPHHPPPCSALLCQCWQLCRGKSLALFLRLHNSGLLRLVREREWGWIWTGHTQLFFFFLHNAWIRRGKASSTWNYFVVVVEWRAGGPRKTHEVCLGFVTAGWLLWRKPHWLFSAWFCEDNLHVNMICTDVCHC